MAARLDGAAPRAADRLCRYGEGGNPTASANTFQSVTAYQSNPDFFESL